MASSLPNLGVISIIIAPVIILLISAFLANAMIAGNLQTGNPYGSSTTVTNGTTYLTTYDPQFFNGGYNNSYPAFANETLGCQGNTSYCFPQTIQILSPNTIPTCIIDLSWTCFVNAIQNLNPQSPYPFTLFNNPSGLTPYNAVCENVNSTVWANSIPNVVYVLCDEVFQNKTQVPEHESLNYYVPLNCSFYATIAGGNPFAYWFCTYDGNNPNSAFLNNTQNMILAQLANQAPVGSCMGSTSSCELALNILPVSIEGGNIHQCPYITKVNWPPICTSLDASVTQQENQSGNNNFGIALILGFVGGLFLFIVGTGVSFNIGIFTNNFGISPNSQGTRLAQTLGFALLLWIPALAETNNILAVLGWGIGSALYLVLTLTLIIGVMAQTLKIA